MKPRVSFDCVLAQYQRSSPSAIAHRHTPPTCTRIMGRSVTPRRPWGERAEHASPLCAAECVHASAPSHAHSVCHLLPRRFFAASRRPLSFFILFTAQFWTSLDAENPTLPRWWQHTVGLYDFFPARVRVYVDIIEPEHNLHSLPSCGDSACRCCLGATTCSYLSSRHRQTREGGLRRRSSSTPLNKRLSTSCVHLPSQCHRPK